MARKTKLKKQPLMVNREFQIRALEGEGNERKFALSFSSEEPYTRYYWDGPCAEILDHSEGCVRTERLSSIGCVLFNHNRDDVIGKVLSIEIKNGRGEAIIEIDDDEFSETIYQKMKSGTLKGVSVGYIIYITENVKKGAKSSDGRFEGPCVLVKDWEPYEISIVTVPADPTVGVGRDLEEPEDINTDSKQSLDLIERQLLINRNSSLPL